MRPRFRHFLFLLLSLTVLSSCDVERRRISVGGSDEIVVWTDDANWETYGPLLEDLWYQTVRTPREEQVFSVRRVELESWGGLFNRYRNQVLCAPLDSGTQAGSMVRQYISEDAQQRIRSQREGIFFVREDIWAVDQLFIIITAPTGVELVDYLERNRSELWDLLEARYDERVGRLLFRQGEEFDIEEQLHRDYDFLVRVPWDYRLDDSRGDESFVRMINYVPERLFFAYWVPVDSLQDRGLAWVRRIESLGPLMEAGTDPEPEDLVRLGQEAMNFRDRITRQYYDRDRLNRDYTTVSISDFKGRWALRLRGLWQNDEKVVGGAVVSYCFVDPATRRLWWLDGALFAPEMTRKEIYFRRLDMLLRTFMTGDEAERYLADPRGAAREDR